MNKNRVMRNVNWFLFGGILIISFMLYNLVNADDDHRGHHDGTDIDIGATEIDIGGDTLSIAGDKAFAVGGSSFDVDINQCLASKATNIVVVGWQTLKENPTCIADGLDARGNHEAAARVRCKHVKTIVSAFDDFELCITAVTMEPVGLPPNPPTGTATKPDDDENERYAEQQEEIEYLREETASLLGQIEYVTQRIERAPRPQVDAGAQRRAKSREAYEKVLAEGTEQ